ncbi:MAG: desulfoferrodoxin [Peptococcaceae bacterium]|jgi:superoxide reductase|nr:desulfoferrodoxin [Peptococcaceae bacterium]
MTELRDLYKCQICGNVVEIVHPGAPALVCCGQPMEKLIVKTEDKGQEKHVPVIEATEDGVLVKVGSVEHPMEEKHYIKFIEILTDSQVLRAELNIDQKPEAFFQVKPEKVLAAREYCNLHGLWQKDM